MSVINRIRYNSFYSLSSSVIRLFTNFLFFIGIARFYGTSTFGSFTAAHTLTLMFLSIADFGLDILLTTEIARSKENASKLLVKYFPLKLMLSVVALCGACLIPLFENLSRQTSILIIILSFNVVFTAITNYFFAFFKGLEQFQHETKISLCINLLLLLLITTLGFMKLNIEYLALAFIFTRALGLGLAVLRLKKIQIISTFSFSFIDVIKDWKIISIFGLHLLFGNLYFQLDTVLLSIWKGDIQVGIYQAAFKIMMFTLIIPDVLINAFLPILSNYHAENKEKWLHFARLLNKTLFMFSIPIALILFINAENIIELFYGKGMFYEAPSILKIFAIMIVIRFSSEASALLLTTSGRQYMRVVIVLLAVIINIILNSFLIPKYGPIGAAIVSLLTNLVVGLCYFLANDFSYVKIFFNLKELIILFGAISLGFLFYNIINLNWIIEIMIILIIFGYSKLERNTIFNWKT
jgi:O-antigen/teichoic acid export membrane protein